MALEISTSVPIKPIGIIHSPYKTMSEAPYQRGERTNKIEVFPEYAEALKDIDEFSHFHVFYWLHQSGAPALLVRTPWDETPHGLFATRSPNRINPIGYSVALLVKREGNVLVVKGLDAIDKTPVLDIKPYIPEFDAQSNVRTGWLEKRATFLQARVYEFKTAIEYAGGKKGILSGAGKHHIEAGCSVEFGGKKEYWSPQHLFVGSVETCIITTFLWLLEKSRLRIESYRSVAAGKAQLRNKDFVFTEVEIKPVITMATEVAKEVIENLIIQAGKECMVSNSVNCPVIIQPLIKIKTSGTGHEKA